MALEFLSKIASVADDLFAGVFEGGAQGDISKFISQVKTRGLARPSHFIVTLNTPPTLSISERKEALGGDVKRYPEMLALLCKSAQLPGLTYATNQIRTFGEPLELPYEKIYDNVSLTFYVDANMEVKSFFDQWVDSIQLYSNKGFDFYDNYKTTIMIDVLNMGDHVSTDTGSGKEHKVYSVLLNEAYPKSIQAIELDYENSGVMLLTVNFQYRNWISSSFQTTDSGIKNVMVGLFGDNPIFKGVMSTYGWIGSVLSTADSYIDRFERIEGGLDGLRKQAKNIPGLLKSKTERIKKLGDFF